jgi:nucleotide-binding universal stress UspA family protein
MLTVPATKPTYSRLVVPLDGSSFAESALSAARELSETFHARLDLAGFGLECGDEAALEQRLLDVADEYDDAHIWTGINWNVAEGITEVVTGGSPALVCMASHARHGMGGAILGSIAAEVLATWREPVLLVGPDYQPSRRMTAGPVVVAVDGTAASENALGLAAGWADRLGVGLDVVTVVEPVPEPPAGHHTHRHHGRGDDPEGYMADLADAWRTADRPVAARVLYDPVNVAVALTDYVAASRAGLVVLVSRPRGGAARAILGSVANDIVRHSPVPVLVAPRFEQAER